MFRTSNLLGELRVLVVKVQPLQVRVSNGPVTPSAFSILPLAVELVHLSSVLPDVSTSRAAFSDGMLKPISVPDDVRLASGQGDSWMVQKTEPVRTVPVSTDNVFSAGSVSVYSAVHLTVSGQALALPGSFLITALIQKISGLAPFSAATPLP